MALQRLAIVSEPLDAAGIARELELESRFVGEGCGAVCTFLGLVRATHRGRSVQYLVYEAYEPLALRAFELIVREALEHWPTARLAIHHRAGKLAIGEASVVIAAAGAHRDEAFRMCRYAIERVKQIAPIWKHEFFDDGEAWVEGAVADPADETARRDAFGRACA